MNREKTIVKDMAGKEPILHPTDKHLVVFTNGAEHFICETPTGHERFINQTVMRRATEVEIQHHRSMAAKSHIATPFLW